MFDLDSTNGTFINDKRIEPRKYIELKPWARLRFGCDVWNYVVIIESSGDGDSDDDVREVPRAE